MTQEIYFIAKSGTPSFDCLGIAEGHENVLHAFEAMCALNAEFTSETDALLEVGECLSLIADLPEKDRIDPKVIKGLNRLAEDELIRVSLDY